MTNLTPGTLWQAQAPYSSVINPGDTLELVKVERGPNGEPVALVFVGFTGPAIVLRIVAGSNGTATELHDF